MSNAIHSPRYAFGESDQPPQSSIDRDELSELRWDAIFAQEHADAQPLIGGDTSVTRLARKAAVAATAKFKRVQRATVGNAN